MAMSDSDDKKNRYYGVIRPTTRPGYTYLVAEVIDRYYLYPQMVSTHSAVGSEKAQVRKLRRWLKKELALYNTSKGIKETIEWP